MSIKRLLLIGIGALVCIGGAIEIYLYPDPAAPHQSVFESWLKDTPVVVRESSETNGRMIHAFAVASTAWSASEGKQATTAERQAADGLMDCMRFGMRTEIVRNGKLVRLTRPTSPEVLILSCEQQATYWPETTPEMRRAVARRQGLNYRFG